MGESVPPPDFYLGERGEWVVPDFDGQGPRACRVLGRVRPAPSGQVRDNERYLWVSVDPPLPAAPRSPEQTGSLREVVLGERYEGSDLEDFGDQSISVNVFQVHDSTGLRRGLVEPGAVSLLARGDVAREPSLLPRTEQEFFELAVLRLEQFAVREGHVEVPEDHEEDGMRLTIWLSNMRYLYAERGIRPEWAERLEAVPGWRWRRG